MSTRIWRSNCICCVQLILINFSIHVIFVTLSQPVPQLVNKRGAYRVSAIHLIHQVQRTSCTARLLRNSKVATPPLELPCGKLVFYPREILRVSRKDVKIRGLTEGWWLRQMETLQQRKGYKLCLLEYLTNQSQNRKITRGLSKRRNVIPVISGIKKKNKDYEIYNYILRHTLQSFQYQFGIIVRCNID